MGGAKRFLYSGRKWFIHSIAEVEKKSKGDAPQRKGKEREKKKKVPSSTGKKKKSPLSPAYPANYDPIRAGEKKEAPSPSQRTFFSDRGLKSPARLKKGKKKVSLSR